MKVKTTTMAILYDEIMQGLTEAIDEREEAAIWNHATGMFKLRDFRTVGLTVPRQCGRTRYAVERLKANERAILLVHSKNLREALTEHTHAYTGRKLNAYECSRIYTTWDVRRAINSYNAQGQDLLCQAVDEVIVDDALYFFENVKRNSFYKWLADRGGDNQKIFLLS
ncbi:hypothetical protein [Streptomyces sp. CHB9.2]|uniref:hypothetical protein n=1 Tax=Streptomyces sp. CHB9.2 TaxID=2841670 RepID=UPI002094BFD0|nr:hypothetical protein [Streptomyces sp. CHB9.2]MCO6704684.1 hypothetical protein [Streptomyces sp. CHB9.2]